MTVRTLGIDLAAQPKNTAACLITWNSNHAKIDALRVGLTDNDLVQLGESANKIGLDAPLGWPTKFVKVISAYHQGGICEECSNQELRFRATDHHVKTVTQRWPLSVSTDLIGVVSLRAIRLLNRLTHEAQVDRTGFGK